MTEKLEMVAAATPHDVDRLNGEYATTESRKRGQANGARKRHDSTLDIVDAQQVLMKIIKGAVRYMQDDGEIIDVPAREIAQCASALVKLEAQKRANLGKANPAPVKAEPRQRAGSRSSRVLVESDQPAQVPIQPKV